MFNVLVCAVFTAVARDADAFHVTLLINVVKDKLYPCSVGKSFKKGKKALLSQHVDRRRVNEVNTILSE